MECFRLLFDHLAWIEHQFLSGIKDSWKTRRLGEMMRGRRSKEVNTPDLIGQRVRVRVTMLRFSGSSGRDSVGRGQHSSNRASRTMYQSTTPSLSQTTWPRWASRHFLSLPTVQTLLPVTFAYSLSSRKNVEAVVRRQLRRWNRLWRRSLTRSHKRISMWLSRNCWNSTSALQPEEITSKGTRVSCVYYQ